MYGYNLATHADAWSVYVSHLYSKLLPQGVLTFNVAMKIGALAEKRSVEWIVTTCGAVVENHKNVIDRHFNFAIVASVYSCINEI